MSARTFVVGTAGHVDHGKSSLVRALTGTDPDRLAEEQLRQMTIDLGFAEFETPTGNHVHLVDVPGHERFVRNMLAGAGGIDAALLAIAADDGPMPQTREHLAILDLLGIETGVVAVTKSDLVDDEWLAFVIDSIRELLSTTTLVDIEIVPVSSTTGAGLAELQEALDRALAMFERPTIAQPARLPIDRVFSMPGFGVVVTGTLTGASLRAGERVEISPGGRLARIRGLQTFGAAVDVASSGSRVAVNLAGLETTELQRGDVLSEPGSVHPAMRIDARVRLLDSSERALAHNDEVIIFAGSAETPARVAILAGDALHPGNEGWVQLRVARPIVVLPGDRFILRRPSPPETIGGGTVVALDPPRHKRNQPEVVAWLDELAADDPGERLLAWFGRDFKDGRQLATSPMGAEDSRRVVELLLADGRLQRVGSYFATTAYASEVLTTMTVRVEAFHHANPLDAGMPRELLRDVVKLERGLLEALLATSDALELDGPLVRRTGFCIVLDADRQRQADRYLDQLEGAAFQPPTPEEAGVAAELVRAMSHMGWIVEIGDGIVFTPARLSEARTELRMAFDDATAISLAEYRDRLGTTRRYAQALLEYFDRQRITRRIGDRRVAVRPIEHQEDVATR